MNENEAPERVLDARRMLSAGAGTLMAHIDKEGLQVPDVCAAIGDLPELLGRLSNALGRAEVWLRSNDHVAYDDRSLDIDDSAAATVTIEHLVLRLHDVRTALLAGQQCALAAATEASHLGHRELPAVSA